MTTNNPAEELQAVERALRDALKNYHTHHYTKYRALYTASDEWVNDLANTTVERFVYHWWRRNRLARTDHK